MGQFLHAVCNDYTIFLVASTKCDNLMALSLWTLPWFDAACENRVAMYMERSSTTMLSVCTKVPPRDIWGPPWSVAKQNLGKVTTECTWRKQWCHCMKRFGSSMRALTAPFMYCLFFIGEPCTHFNTLKRGDCDRGALLPIITLFCLSVLFLAEQFHIWTHKQN